MFRLLLRQTERSTHSGRKHANVLDRNTYIAPSFLPHAFLGGKTIFNEFLFTANIMFITFMFTTLMSYCIYLYALKEYRPCVLSGALKKNELVRIYLRFSVQKGWEAIYVSMCCGSSGVEKCAWWIWILVSYEEGCHVRAREISVAKSKSVDGFLEKEFILKNVKDL